MFKSSQKPNTLSSVRISVLAVAVATLLSGASANAADMLEDGTQNYGTEEYTEVEFGTGWYLRGDVGLGSSSANSSDVASAFSITAAAGRTFSEGFRMEAAYNHYGNLDYSLEAQNAACAAGNNLNTASCTYWMSASTLMANGYLDFGKFAGFTPYVGAGVGAAYLSGNNLTYAANAMLGVSYDISKDLKLDFGYRYTLMGDGGVAQGVNSAGATQDVVAGSVDVHELRIGFRYEIW